MRKSHPFPRHLVAVTLALLAAAGASFAGVNKWVVAAVDDPCEEPNPPPYCGGGGCKTESGGGGCNQQNYGEYFTNPPSIASIARDAVFTSTELEGGRLASAMHYFGGVGLLVRDDSVAALVHPLSGEVLKRIVPASAGLQIAAIDLDAQLEAFDVFDRANSIYRFDLRSGTLLPVLKAYMDPGRFTPVTAVTLASTRWLVETQDKASDLYRLYLVEDLGGQVSVLPIGGSRATRLLALALGRDRSSPYMALAVDAAGAFLGVSRDFEVVPLGTGLGAVPVTVTITTNTDQPGTPLVVYATGVTGELLEADPTTGTITSHGKPRYFSNVRALAVVQEPLPDERFYVVNNGPDYAHILRITNGGGDRMPNFPEIQVNDLLRRRVKGEVRTAVGEFGLVPGYVAGTQLFVSEYDKTLTSIDAAHVMGFSLVYRDQSGLPAPLVMFEPFGGMNKAGATLARVRRAGRPDALAIGAGPSPVYGPQVNLYEASPSRVEMLRRYAFYGYGTMRWGINVAAGDVDGDGVDELLTGPGPGGSYGAHLRGYWVEPDRLRVSPIQRINAIVYGTLGGLNVACPDLDGDGKDDLVTLPGTFGGNAAHLRGFTFKDGVLAALPLNLLLGTRCQGGVMAATGADAIATLGVDDDAGVFIVRAKAGGGYSVSSWTKAGGASARATGGIVASLGGPYSGKTVPRNWNVRIQVFANLVTHVWIDYAIDDPGCSRTGTAVFHLGNLPGGGAPIDAQGNFSFTAYESNGLPFSIAMDGQFQLPKVAGNLTFTDSNCGLTLPFTYEAKR